MKEDTFYLPNKKVDKGVLFFSCSAYMHTKTLLEGAVYDSLISYHYIRKSRSQVLTEFLPEIKKQGGYFMTDSGAFTLLKKDILPEQRKEEFWLRYIEEYVEFLENNASSIYVCANMDLDTIVGRDVVDKWNEKYFRPLEKKMNVIYLVHKDLDNVYGDKTGIHRLHSYLKQYEYIGVNNSWSRDVGKVFSLAKQYKRRVHGFALTAVSSMTRFPFFSHDSTTWLGAAKFGNTYLYDGKNFKVVMSDQKHRRKANKSFLERQGVNFEDVYIGRKRKLGYREDENAVNRMSLEAWKGARTLYLRSANRLLWNKPIDQYNIIEHAR